MDCAECQLRSQLALATERAEAAETANEVMRSTMHAAAEEIEQHWDAHCDDEGFGPVNLHRRLKEGTSSGGCYPAFCSSGKAFTEALAAAEADVKRIKQLAEYEAIEVYDRNGHVDGNIHWGVSGDPEAVRGALDVWFASATPPAAAGEEEK